MVNLGVLNVMCNGGRLYVSLESDRIDTAMQDRNQVAGYLKILSLELNNL